MYDGDTATALLFPKLRLRNNMETQPSQQQSWTWKGGQVFRYENREPQQTQTPLYFPAKALW